MLIGYTMVALSSQFVWLNFSGILTPQFQDVFHAGLGMLGLMSAVWPLVFIPLSIPVGLLIDRRGFRVPVLAGAGTVMVFSWLRLLAGTDFEVLFVFQSLASVGQPFIFNGISKLSGEWFPRQEQALANGIGTMGQILGMILALVTVPLMVPSPSYAEIVRSMVLVSAVCTASFLAFLAFSREQPMATPPEASAHFMGSMRSVIRIRNIQVLMALFFIGVGVFSSLAQWIETIMAGRGISPLDGGITGAIMLVAGISGMVAVPVVAEKWGSLRKFVIANSLFSALFLFALSFRMPAGYYFVVSFAEGFFLISLAPLGLQISLESAGEENAGTAAGLIWLLSQVGALLLIVVVPSLYSLQDALRVEASDPGFLAVLVLAILVLAGALLSLMIRETRPGAGSGMAGQAGVRD
ncbi:hypothetical protein GCM10007108_14350 [Thermogymnomonas acidicola]|uniref:Major facilitator superfamily (MFS) profile domain-containing protein n=1 Tax=Thermogymnomonas acidicola TaxID=399579 RepID=A0AA37BSC8_9ARCH|nr:hypothetical protein GCM10007108_14350 [Thermogymnomonas acidicola]